MITALFVGAMAAAGIVLIVFGAMAGQAKDAATLAQERLARQSIAPITSLSELELSAPLAQRVLQPVVDRLAVSMERMTPERQATDFRQRLDLAGNPYNLDATRFQALRFLGAAALAVLGLAAGLLLGNTFLTLVLLVVGGVGGLLAPTMWLNQQVSTRRTSIEIALPEALDIVSISMEAGLNFDQALAKLADNLQGPLGQEAVRAVRLIRLGRPRTEALEQMADRCGVEDLHALVRSVTQAERSGVPVARIIRVHTEQMRQKRRVRIRTLSAQAALKMLFPTVGCIFPTLWLVLLGPAVLVVMTLMGH